MYIVVLVQKLNYARVSVALQGLAPHNCCPDHRRLWERHLKDMGGPGDFKCWCPTVHVVRLLGASEEMFVGGDDYEHISSAAQNS